MRTLHFRVVLPGPGVLSFGVHPINHGLVVASFRLVSEYHGKRHLSIFSGAVAEGGRRVYEGDIVKADVLDRPSKGVIKNARCGFVVVVGEVGLFLRDTPVYSVLGNPWEHPAQLPAWAR